MSGAFDGEKLPILKLDLRTARQRGRLAQLVRRLGRLEDRLNPILVKEARQSIKSRQFLVVFALVLICCWAWTFLGVYLVGEGEAYGGYGDSLFMGYWVVLAFPLLVAVPFGAYRSLATEIEDGTYELLSITSLGPRQIVAGKLASAALQMLIYLSAVSPCLAFTYMLRGIDLATMLTMLIGTVLASLGLSVAALVMGTTATQRHWQVMMTVTTIAGLIASFFLGIFTVALFLFEEPIPFEEPEIWLVFGCLLTFLFSTAVVLFLAAAAQITFRHANRSTALRLALLTQFALFLGWVAAIWGGPGKFDDAREVAIVALSISGAYWWMLGGLMTGENPHLSSRVQRGLPRTQLGRLCLSWLQPGPGRGYLFALSNLAVAAALVFAIGVWLSVSGRARPNTWSGPVSADELYLFMLVGFSYVTLFLGLGKLLLDQMRRVTQVGPAVGGLVQVVLVTFLSLAPMLLLVVMPSLRFGGFSALFLPNPFVTLAEIVDGATIPAEVWAVPVAAAVVFVLNLRSLGQELNQTWTAAPARVQEEEAALAPPAPAPLPQSPWD